MKYGEKVPKRMEKLSPGLYIVATPIGAARDITLKALDILSAADILLAEDTRTLRKLLDIHGVDLRKRPIRSYHDHSHDNERTKILQDIAAGASVALVSDAGTPMISDPGFALSRDVVAAGHLVTAAPGASAVLTALCLAGMPTDRFMFAGFIPSKTKARSDLLTEFAPLKSTLVFYESPKRVVKTLAAMDMIYGSSRDVAVCRELTKKFEEVIRGSIFDVHAELESRASIKGEIVLVLGPPKLLDVTDDEILKYLGEKLRNQKLKQAAHEVADELGVSKKRAYSLGLALKG